MYLWQVYAKKHGLRKVTLPETMKHCAFATLNSRTNPWKTVFLNLLFKRPFYTHSLLLSILCKSMKAGPTLVVLATEGKWDQFKCSYSKWTVEMQVHLHSKAIPACVCALSVVFRQPVWSVLSLWQFGYVFLFCIISIIDTVIVSRFDKPLLQMAPVIR